MAVAAITLSLLVVLIVETSLFWKELWYLFAEPRAQKLILGSWKLTDVKKIEPKESPENGGGPPMRWFTHDHNMWTFFSDHTMEEGAWDEDEHHFYRALMGGPDSWTFAWDLSGNRLRLTSDDINKPKSNFGPEFVDWEFGNGVTIGEFGLKDGSGSGSTLLVSRPDPYFAAVLVPVPRVESHPGRRRQLLYLNCFTVLVLIPLLGAAWTHRRTPSTRKRAVIRAVLCTAVVAFIAGAVIGLWNGPLWAMASILVREGARYGVVYVVASIPFALVIGFFHPIGVGIPTVSPPTSAIDSWTPPKSTTDNDPADDATNTAITTSAVRGQIIKCPHCNIRVCVTSDGACPSCRKPI